MKKSNIILLALFLSILIGGTLLVFVGVYEVKNLGTNLPTEKTILHDKKTSEVVVAPALK